MEEKRENPLIFYIFYFVVFFGGAIYGSFISMYLSNAGMKSETIGLVNGIIQIISLVAYPVWGILADRAKTKNTVLIIELILIIATLVFFNFAKGVLMLAIAMIVFSIFNQPMHGVYETITIEHARLNNWKYSPIRMTGTFGFSLMALLAGFWLSKEETLIFPIYIGSMILTLICAFCLPKTENIRRQREEKTEGKKESVYVMLKNKRVRNVLILMATYMMCNSFNGTYFGIFMGKLGGDYTHVGIANMIMGLAEVPFHIGPGRRWMQRIGVEKSMLCVMAAGTIRYTIAAFSQNPWVLVWTMAFNGIMLVPTIVGVVEFLYNMAPDHLKTSAQNALKSPFQIGGMLIANLVFGRIAGMLDAAGHEGIRIVYMGLGPICLIVGLIIGIPILRRRTTEDEEEAQAEA